MRLNSELELKKILKENPSIKVKFDSLVQVGVPAPREVTFTVPDVCSKPRMTRSDRWRQRPAVVRYRQFADLVRVSVPDGRVMGNADQLELHVTIQMPKSWGKKRRASMSGQPHRTKPDADNLLKAVADALFPENDSFIWRMAITKVWGDRNETRVTVRF